MLGRSCRSRGVCDGRIYVNTGEDEPAFLRRITVTDYNKMTDYVEVLIRLSVVQKNPTEPELLKNGRPSTSKLLLLRDVEVAQDEWNKGNYLTSLKTMRELINLKEALDD